MYRKVTLLITIVVGMYIHYGSSRDFASKSFCDSSVSWLSWWRK